MKRLIKITRQIDSVTKENLFSNRRIIHFNFSDDIIWKGSKRYAH